MTTLQNNLSESWLCKNCDFYRQLVSLENCFKMHFYHMGWYLFVNLKLVFPSTFSSEITYSLKAATPLKWEILQALMFSERNQFLNELFSSWGESFYFVILHRINIFNTDTMFQSQLSRWSRKTDNIDLGMNISILQ